jgi:hypothetical protein
MKTAEDEAFEDIERRQGGGFPAKRAMAVDKLHWSDCAVHNGPAYPAGPCDCGVAQEPVAWTLLLIGEHHGIIGKAGEQFLGHPKHYERVDVYTTPPKREWVGLTDEELADYLGNEYHNMTTSELRFFRLGEAATKEKNT